MLEGRASARPGREEARLSAEAGAQGSLSVIHNSPPGSMESRPTIALATMLAGRCSAEPHKDRGVLRVGIWVAHASRVLVSASRRNNLFESPRKRDAIANMHDACAHRAKKARTFTRLRQLRNRPLTFRLG